MLQEIIWTLKPLILPPGGLLILALLGFALGKGWFGRFLVFMALLGLWLLSTPLVSSTLAQRAQQGIEPVAASAIRQAEAIVVLGGGLYAGAPEYGGDTVAGELLERLRYAAWLSRSTDLPVIPTGGSGEAYVPEARLAAQVLREEFGVRVAAVEDRSRTTRENALFTAKILKRKRIGPVLLVTHARHMRRALRAFKRAGVEALPAPTLFKAEQRMRFRDLLPDAAALKESSQALHEQLGRLWYRLRNDWKESRGERVQTAT